jgi:raffinose/stachyose/melibiose transport system substrate-binding protein
MKKRNSLFALFISLLLVLAMVLVACGPAETDEPAPAEDTVTPDEPDQPEEPDVPLDDGGLVEITLINNKVEIDGALREFAALYEDMFGVRVNIQSFGGETPYAPALAAMLGAGEEPEIFVFEGYTDYTEARAGNRLTDLSDQPWVADTDVAFYDTEGRVVGFPVAIEGWGLGYNAEILRQAGVDPATMTNIDGMRAAF